MTKLNSSRLIQLVDITFHVDYVCGLEYREGYTFITYKQGGFSKVRTSRKEFNHIQSLFLTLGM